MSLLDKYINISKELNISKDEFQNDIKSIAEVMKNRLESEKGRIIILTFGTVSGMIGSMYWDLEKNFNIDTDRIIILSTAQTYREHVEDWNTLIGLRSAATLELSEFGLCEEDAVIVISSSGQSEYTRGAEAYAKTIGCNLSIISNKKESVDGVEYDNKLILPIDDYHYKDVRFLEAATSLKIMFDCVISELAQSMGRIYKGWSVSMRWKSSTTYEHAIEMISEIAGLDIESSKEQLSKADDRTDIAMLMHLKDWTKEKAETELNKVKGNFVKIVQ